MSYTTDKIFDDFDSFFLTEIILTDLQEAFNTINHNVLLQKLPLVFSNEVIDWGD